MNLFANNAIESIKKIDDFIVEGEIDVTTTLNDIYGKVSYMQESTSDEYIEHEYIQESALAGALIGGGIISVIAAAIALLTKVLKKEATSTTTTDSDGNTSEDGIALKPEETRKKGIKKLKEQLEKHNGKVKVNKKLNVENFKKLADESVKVVNAFTNLLEKSDTNSLPEDITLMANAKDIAKNFKNLKVVEDFEGEFTVENLEDFDTIGEYYTQIEAACKDINDKIEAFKKKAGNNTKQNESGKNDSNEQQQQNNSDKGVTYKELINTVQELGSTMSAANASAIKSVKQFYAMISKNIKSEDEAAKKNTPEQPSPKTSTDATDNNQQQQGGQNGNGDQQQTQDANNTEEPSDSVKQQQELARRSEEDKAIDDVATTFVHDSNNGIRKQQRDASGKIVDVPNGPIIKFENAKEAADLLRIIVDAKNSGKDITKTIQDIYDSTDYEHGYLLKSMLTSYGGVFGIRANLIPSPSIMSNEQSSAEFEPRPISWSNIDEATNVLKQVGPSDADAINNSINTIVSNIGQSTTNIDKITNTEIDSINAFINACKSITVKNEVAEGIVPLIGVVHRAISSAKAEYGRRTIAAQNQKYTAEPDVAQIDQALHNVSDELFNLGAEFSTSQQPQQQQQTLDNNIKLPDGKAIRTALNGLKGYLSNAASHVDDIKKKVDAILDLFADNNLIEVHAEDNAVLNDLNPIKTIATSVFAKDQTITDINNTGANITALANEFVKMGTILDTVPLGNIPQDGQSRIAAKEISDIGNKMLSVLTPQQQQQQQPDPGNPSVQAPTRIDELTPDQMQAKADEIKKSVNSDNWNAAIDDSEQPMYVPIIPNFKRPAELANYTNQIVADLPGLYKTCIDNKSIKKAEDNVVIRNIRYTKINPDEFENSLFMNLINEFTGYGNNLIAEINAARAKSPILPNELLVKANIVTNVLANLKKIYNTFEMWYAQLNRFVTESYNFTAVDQTMDGVINQLTSMTQNVPSDKAPVNEANAFIQLRTGNPATNNPSELDKLAANTKGSMVANANAELNNKIQNAADKVAADKLAAEEAAAARKAAIEVIPRQDPVTYHPINDVINKHPEMDPGAIKDLYNKIKRNELTTDEYNILKNDSNYAGLINDIAKAATLGRELSTDNVQSTPVAAPTPTPAPTVAPVVNNAQQQQPPYRTATTPTGQNYVQSLENQVNAQQAAAQRKNAAKAPITNAQQAADQRKNAAREQITNAQQAADQRKNAARPAQQPSKLVNFVNKAGQAVSVPVNAVRNLTNKGKQIFNVHQNSYTETLDDGTEIIHESYVFEFSDGTSETVIIDNE